MSRAREQPLNRFEGPVPKHPPFGRVKPARARGRFFIWGRLNRRAAPKPKAPQAVAYDAFATAGSAVVTRFVPIAPSVVHIAPATTIPPCMSMGITPFCVAHADRVTPAAFNTTIAAQLTAAGT